MVSMATSCVAKSSGKYHHLAEYLDQPLNFIASHQLSDGSFGNIHTTTMAIQALQLVDTLHLSINRSVPLTVTWKKQASVDWLRNNQRLDGSFGDVFTTSQVLLALSHRGYATVNYNECHQPQPVLEPWPTTQSPATAAPKGICHTTCM
jgi:prenyltransferase beta subunit